MTAAETATMFITDAGMLGPKTMTAPKEFAPSKCIVESYASRRASKVLAFPCRLKAQNR